MKSYYQHLSSTREFGEKKNILKKPILRSSAIFPVVYNEFYSSAIHFLGYWLLKRNIPEVTLIITLRDKTGKILLREIKIINEPKAFSINLKDILKKINYTSDFVGSIETEFNTTRDMVFPYPALVLEYYNKKFNTCVHTLGRIYNDFEDLNENEIFRVPETGFDIHETEDLYSFLSFVNGPKKNENGHIEYTITNSKSEKYKGSFSLGKINPFETKLIFFKDEISDIGKILDNQHGSISLKHNFEGFYPRFLVGNIQRSFPSVSFTHSYYDCTSCSSELDFWNRSDEKHHDSSVYVPIFNQDNQFTNLMIYPNFSPSDYILQVDIHDESGVKLYSNPNFLEIKNSDNKLLKINLNEFIPDQTNSQNNNFSAHVITYFKNNKIPSRIKFGLNVGNSESNFKLPCNICFNMRMGNPLIENKPGSFHWAPIFLERNTVLALGNFSTLKNYEKTANLELNFYRIEDSSNFSKKISLSPNSEKRFSIDDFELNDFLKTEGWVTIKADNPYVHGYYFNLNSSGSISGDHLF
mgnify:CR=1 FL=1